MNEKAQTTGPKSLIFTPLLGQKGGLLGQWPTSYYVKRCPVRGPKIIKNEDVYEKTKIEPWSKTIAKK